MSDLTHNGHPTHQGLRLQGHQDNRRRLSFHQPRKRGYRSLRLWSRQVPIFDPQLHPRWQELHTCLDMVQQNRRPRDVHELRAHHRPSWLSTTLSCRRSLYHSRRTRVECDGRSPSHVSRQYWKYGQRLQDCYQWYSVGHAQGKPRHECPEDWQ